jgi:hypothetical protein
MALIQDGGAGGHQPDEAALLLERFDVLNIPEEVRRSHHDLGPLNDEFLDFVARNPAALRRSSFAAVHKWGMYPLTSWPVFVGGSKLEEIKRCSIEMTRLYKKVPFLAFRGNAELMATFYRIADASLVPMILTEPSGFDSARSRVDLVESEAGLKCLEVNLGCPGGLQVPMAAEAYLASPVLQEFLTEQRRPVHCTGAVEVLLTEVVLDVLRTLSWRGPDLHIGILVEEMYEAEFQQEITERMGQILDLVLARHAPSYHGTVKLVTPQSLQVRPDGIWCQGIRLVGIIEQYTLAWNLTFRCQKARQVGLYNGPAALIMDDKRNLALLSEMESSPLLTCEEQQMVRSWVPWTRQLKAGYTRRDGERVNLVEYVGAHREHLVLKPARSSQGDNVYLGAWTPPETWDRVMREALPSGEWVVQEYHESRPYLCQIGGEGCSVHDLIWGIFVFGSRYGGGFMRVLPKGRGEAINASQGALEAPILEVGEEPGHEAILAGGAGELLS